ncbi:MAG: FusB/FusC family EF-G-binding protein [Lactobacillales bacterium]|jgi:hypothetical protein|nr:FusB/FusC family EF-G-binding protein [Lactobacillales bacterium]
MGEKLKPHEYWHLRNQCTLLVNAYHSVNDKRVHESLQVQTGENVRQLIPSNVYAEEALLYTMNKELSRARLANYFDGLLEHVEPFEKPSRKQLEKTFRKVKKLNEPEWDLTDLRENTYYGWNDAGSGRKYILARREGKLEGVYGTLATEVINGACAICKQIDGVSMFLATVKSGAEGTYTKRGNYICRDSQKCNQHLYSLDSLNEFLDNLK